MKKEKKYTEIFEITEKPVPLKALASENTLPFELAALSESIGFVSVVEEAILDVVAHSVYSHTRRRKSW